MVDICHLYDYENQARIGAIEYAKENCENIKRVIITNSEKMIWTEDGDIHHFMGGMRYDYWSKGRTYMLNDGTLMHSGMPIIKGEQI